MPRVRLSQTLAAKGLTHYFDGERLFFFRPVMALPLDVAMQSLSDSADHRALDPRLATRLEDVQVLLREELEYVEQALARASDHWRRPGRDAARHLVSLGGKRIRPMALLLSAACYGPIAIAARELAVVAELIHSATLLHDDVIDDGMERRGAPAARRVWGNAVSVLAGDLLLVEALERTERHAPAVLPALMATLRELVDGEITQLAGRSNLDVSRDTYERVLTGKTASLFRWATSTGARLGGGSSGDQERFATFGELVGMAFQLIDDVLDYTSSETAKTRLADLREGKLTLPLVLAIERRPDLMTSVRAIYDGDAALLDEVREQVLETNAHEDVRRRAVEYTTRAVSVLRDVPASEARWMLESVALQLTQRDR